MSDGRWCGPTVRTPDLKSGDREVKSCADKQLDLFELVPGSTLWLYLYMTYWSASRLSVAICIVFFTLAQCWSTLALYRATLACIGPHWPGIGPLWPMASNNYQPSHQVKTYYIIIMPSLETISVERLIEVLSIVLV